MTIVHLIDTLGSGGAEKALAANLRSWSKYSKHRHVLVMLFFPDGLSEKSNTFWIESISQLNIEIRYLNCPSKRGLLSAIIRLAQMLRKEKEVLLHTQILWSNLAGRLAAGLAQVPVVSTVQHMDYEPESRSSYRVPLAGIKIAIMCWLDGLTARLFCRHLIAASQAVAQSAAKYLKYPKDRIEVVYNSIDIEYFQNNLFSQDSLIDLRKELGISSTQRVLLHVGRVSSLKNLLFLAKVLGEVRKAIPEVVLLQVGSQADSLYYRSLVQEIKDLNLQSSFLCLGPRRDILKLLHLSEIFVFPSITEGFGIALAEAASQGRCCVASDIAPHREILREGITGRLVALDHSALLAQSIVDLLNDPLLAQSLGKAAQIEVRQKFDPDLLSAKLLKVFESCL